MHSYKHYIEFRPGKFIFVPTDEAKKRGGKLVGDLLKCWTPKEYFYHFGKRGGHVAAMRPHVPNAFKASIDLKGFFSTVTRTKVARSLKKIGFSKKRAFCCATDSCVAFKGKKFLPYGFVESMALATLVIEKSGLGSKIEELKLRGIFVTMYVDDIIISSNDFSSLQQAFQELSASIVKSGFEISDEKCSLPSHAVNAFNCHVLVGDILVQDARLEKFLTSLRHGSENAKEAILRYVGVINKQQANTLELEI